MTLDQRITTDSQSEYHLGAYMAEGQIGFIYRLKSPEGKPLDHLLVKMPKNKSVEPAFITELDAIIGMKEVLESKQLHLFKDIEGGTHVSTEARVMIMPFYNTLLKKAYDERRGTESLDQIEVFAVRMALEYVEVLKALHSGPHRTCTDRKLVDLFLYDGHLEVIDWNMLGDTDPERLQSEVTIWGQLWYELLTGRIPVLPLAYQLDEHWSRNEQTNEQDAAGNISLGLRLILWSALHQIGLQSYEDAEALQKDLENWLRYLNLDRDELAGLIKKETLLPDLPGVAWRQAADHEDLPSQALNDQRLILRDLLWRKGDPSQWGERNKLRRLTDARTQDLMDPMYFALSMGRTDDITKHIQVLRSQPSLRSVPQLNADLARWEHIASLLPRLDDPEILTAMLHDLELSVAYDDYKRLAAHSDVVEALEGRVGQEALAPLRAELEARQFIAEARAATEIETQMENYASAKKAMKASPWAADVVQASFNLDKEVRRLGLLIKGDEQVTSAKAMLGEMLNKTPVDAQEMQTEFQRILAELGQKLGERDVNAFIQWSQKRLRVAHLLERYHADKSVMRKWGALLEDARSMRETFEQVEMGEMYKRLFAEAWQLFEQTKESNRYDAIVASYQFAESLLNAYHLNPKLEHTEAELMGIKLGTAAEQAEILKERAEYAVKAPALFVEAPLQTLQEASARDINLMGDERIQDTLVEWTEPEAMTGKINKDITSKLTAVKEKLDAQKIHLEKQVEKARSELDKAVENEVKIVQMKITNGLHAARTHHLEMEILDLVRQIKVALDQFRLDQAVVMANKIGTTLDAFKDQTKKEPSPMLEAYRTSMAATVQDHQNAHNASGLDLEALRAYRRQVDGGDALSNADRSQVGKAIHRLASKEIEQPWASLERLFDDDSALRANQPLPESAVLNQMKLLDVSVGERVKSFWKDFKSGDIDHLELQLNYITPNELQALHDAGFAGRIGLSQIDEWWSRLVAAKAFKEMLNGIKLDGNEADPKLAGADERNDPAWLEQAIDSLHAAMQDAPLEVFALYYADWKQRLQAVINAMNDVRRFGRIGKVFDPEAIISIHQGLNNEGQQKKDMGEKILNAESDHAGTSTNTHKGTHNG